MFHKSLLSYISQNYNNYHCYVIDDISSDDSYQVARSFIKNNDHFTLIKNTEKRYALGNIAHTLNNADLNDSDVARHDLVRKIINAYDNNL